MRWDEANRERGDPDDTATIQSSIEHISGIEYIDMYKGTDTGLIQCSMKANIICGPFR